MIANPAWVGTVEVVDPAGSGVAVTAQAVWDARAQIADARSWTEKGHIAAAPDSASAALVPVQPVPAGEPAAFLMLQAQVTAYMGASQLHVWMLSCSLYLIHRSPVCITRVFQVKRWPSALLRALTTA